MRADPTPLAPGRAILGLLPLAAGYFLSYLLRNVNGLVANDIMHDLGIGADVLGVLTSVYFLTFAAAQLPIGVALDRFGPRPVQAALFLCTAAGAALCATNGGIAALFWGRALVGLGTAGALVAGLKASAQWFSRDRLPLVNGGFIMCGGLGALAATWPVAFALRSMDWRALFVLFALAAVGVAVAVCALVPSRPRPAAVEVDQVRLLDIARDPLFRRFAPLSASCFGAVLAIQGLWAGPFLADVDRLSPREVADDLAYMAIVLIVSAPLWGILTQRLRRHIRLTRLAFVAALVLVTAELVILSPVGWPPICAWSVFAAFGGMTVLSYSVLAEHFPAAAIGRANGLLNVLHIGFSFAVQLGIGAIVALWPATAGHYPAQAYVAGLSLPVVLQLFALAWFMRRPLVRAAA
jgi:MFS family permease